MKLFPDFIKIKNSFTFQILVTLEYLIFSLLKIKAFKMCFVSVELEHNNIPQSGKQKEWGQSSLLSKTRLWLPLCGFASKHHVVPLEDIGRHLSWAPREIA